MSVLSTTVLQEVHNAAEYLSWVKDLIAKVKLEPDGHKRIRLRIGLAKELINEAFPIGLFAEKYFEGNNRVEISLRIGNQNFDAEVFDRQRQPSSVRYIEVTNAGDGEDDYLRMRKLHNCGEVSGFGKVTKAGTMKTKLEIHVEREMASQAHVLQCERDRVSKAIERKLGKQYPPDTLLLLAFDDTMAFDRQDNIAGLEAVLDEYLLRLDAFHSVAIVGVQRGLYLCKRVEDAI